MNEYQPPEKLSKKHNIKQFDCKNEHLNDYLKKYPFQNQKKNISRNLAKNQIA